MTLELEGLELEKLNMSENELILEIAIMLYSSGRLSMGKASRLVNMNRILFQEELGKRKIAINYNETDLNDDLATLGIR